MVVPVLVWSDSLADDARGIRDRVESDLAEHGVPGELVLTGGVSVRGALTKGDVDLHLRVEPEHFPEAVATLRRHYAVASADAWASTLAVFDVPGPLPTGLAVTPCGSEHDRRFTHTWALIRADPSVLEAYNALKLSSAGHPEYERRKADFFTALRRQVQGSCSPEDL